MKTIPLTQGKVALIDDEDFEKVSQFKWFAQKSSKNKNKYYAVREFRRPSGARAVQLMHAFLMRTAPGFETHHVDNDGLNNQRYNLRVVTRAEHKKIDRDQRRRCLNCNNQTGFKGVSFVTNTKWRAQLSQDGQKIVVGYYSTAPDAAIARDTKARQLGWPEIGMNFPHENKAPPVPIIEHPSRITIRNTSGFRGASFSKRDLAWRAYLSLAGQQYYLGIFDTAEEAARARDKKARALEWPEKVMNFPR